MHLVWLKAWLIGFGLAAPIGPVGLLCIRKTLQQGLRGAILVGLGAALSDSLSTLLILLGLKVIAQFVIAHEMSIKIVSACLLFALAYKELRSSPPRELAGGAELEKGGSNKGQQANLQLTGAIFLLTFSNPLPILSFLGVLAGIAEGSATTAQATSVVSGIFTGHMTWWLILGTIVSKIKHIVPLVWLHYLQYVAALILAGFGLVALIGGLAPLFR